MLPDGQTSPRKLRRFLTYLLESSDAGLKEIAVDRLNTRANRRKEALQEVLEEWIVAEAEVRVAELIEQFRRGSAIGASLDNSANDCPGANVAARAVLDSRKRRNGHRRAANAQEVS